MPSHTPKERAKHRGRRFPTKAKAKEILEHGEVRGGPLTKPQRGLMGVIASGKRPTRVKRPRGKF